MRTRRLRELTLAVAALHAIGWQIAAGGPASFAPARAGVRRFALVSVPQRAKAAAAPVDPAVAPAQPRWPEPVAAPAHERPPPRATPAARAPTGAGGALRRAPVEDNEWPVYATQPPPSTTLRYALVQGGRAAAPDTGSAELEWRRDADAYSLRVATAIDGRPPRDWQSTGTFDAAGVAPLRLVERERGRDKRALSIDRDGARVRFSGAPGALAVAPGVQDRWSWIAQLAAVAEAGARRGQAPVRWDLQVAGLRGELERWTFRVLPPGDPPPELGPQGNELSGRLDRAPALLHVVRATGQPYGLRIEAWLSPALHHLPAGLRMSNPPGNWSLSLWQRSS
jgi:hypothetical protein